MKSFIMVAKKYLKAIKMNDPNAPKGSEENVPGKPGVKILITGK